MTESHEKKAEEDEERRKAKARKQEEYREMNEARAEGIRAKAFRNAWVFPLALAGLVAVSALTMTTGVSLASIGEDQDLGARLTWGVSAILFFVLFSFFVVLCHTFMFKCGRPQDAMLGLGVSMTFGILSVLWGFVPGNPYIGPHWIAERLHQTVFSSPIVRIATGVASGCALWAAVLLVMTSAVILRNEVDVKGLTRERRFVEAENLSRQLRASQMLMQSAAALLVAGVTLTAALHAWPARDERLAAQAEAQRQTAPPSESANTDAGKGAPRDIPHSPLEAAGVAMSTAVGAVFSVLLGAAYLPLGVILRQRAYIVIYPWDRAEMWLNIHGFAIQPTQQFAKILLILGPLIATGPVSYLTQLLPL